MSNLTEITDKLADGQVSLYNIAKRSVERFEWLYGITTMLVEVTMQLEKAVGGDPTDAKFAAINEKIVVAQQQSATDMAAIEDAIGQLPDIDKAALGGMADTKFE
jgi:hypothetical protein